MHIPHGKFILNVVVLLLLTGCVVGAINTREEFVAAMKTGGPFKSVEQTVVSRPVKTVISDMTEYANKCLNVRVTSAPSYQYKSAGGSTTYSAKVETLSNGVTALSVQEQYNDRQQPGAPVGGFFVLVAEVRDAGGHKVQVDIYHNARDKIASPLKRWVAGDKRSCPSLERVL